MPGMNGIELIKRLKQEMPRIRAVIFSSYNEFQFAAEALKFGASEYILKAEITLQGLDEVLQKIGKDIELDHSKLVEINSPAQSTQSEPTSASHSLFQGASARKPTGDE